jgi:hypothetical protein
MAMIIFALPPDRFHQHRAPVDGAVTLAQHRNPNL